MCARHISCNAIAFPDLDFTMPTSLLQPLCKIWYVLPSQYKIQRSNVLPPSQISPPKYRCPRCQIRTCSLPCTKRHKVWYSCSGQRNPAAYKAKNELATPAGIDQDYNFLRGVERVLEQAEERFSTDGIGDEKSNGRGRADAVEQKRSGPKKGEVALGKALGRSGVKVERAPVGMGRAKENGTFFSKK